MRVFQAALAVSFLILNPLSSSAHAACDGESKTACESGKEHACTDKACDHKDDSKGEKAALHGEKCSHGDQCPHHKGGHGKGHDHGKGKAKAEAKSKGEAKGHSDDDGHEHGAEHEH